MIVCVCIDVEQCVRIVTISLYCWLVLIESIILVGRRILHHACWNLHLALLSFHRCVIRAKWTDNKRLECTLIVIFFDIDDNGLRGHGHEKKLFKRRLGNMFLAVEWLVTGMHSQNIVLLVILLTHSKRHLSGTGTGNKVIQEALLTLRGQCGRCRNIKREPQIFGSFPSPNPRLLFLWLWFSWWALANPRCMPNLKLLTAVTIAQCLNS